MRNTNMSYLFSFNKNKRQFSETLATIKLIFNLGLENTSNTKCWTKKKENVGVRI